MNNNLYSDTTQTFLSQIEKYAGFTPFLGLFDGKMGIAILLYHGSRCFCSAELESVADSLIDDIVNEKSLLRENRFAKGSSDIAWGFSHLMLNGFIDADVDFFNDIDDLLFRDETVVDRMPITEYLFLGLYILSRHKNSADKSYWISEADSYCNHVFQLVKTYPTLFITRPDLLTPYWYCLLKWGEYDLPFLTQNKTIGKVCQFSLKFGSKDPKTCNAAIANQFFRKVCQKNEVSLFPEIVTIGDVNTIYLNKLLYQDMVLPQRELLDEAITRIILDNKLLNELFMLLNHQNLGISRYISGFAWTLLQHKS